MNSVRSSQIALAVVVHLVLVARPLRDLDDDRVFHVRSLALFGAACPCAVGTLPQVSSETGPARVDRDVAFERQWLDDGTWVDMARGWITDAPEAYDTLAHAVPWAPRRLWRYERWIEEPRVSHGYRAGQPVPHPVLLETHARSRRSTA